MPSPSNPKLSAAAACAEFREDLRGEPVLITPGRAARPYHLRSDAEQRRKLCPFCEGHEGETPPEVAAGRPDGSSPDSPGWRWRAFPNLYPAFPREPEKPGGAYGVHEVIVETPDHDRGLADLTEPELAAVLGAWQQRLRAAAEDPRMEYANIFKNHGVEAGASQEHAHSQLMAIPLMPRRVADELAAFRDGSAGRRLWADRESAALRVADQDGYVAFAPSAARFPDEVWIVPPQPESAFEDAEDLSALAVLLGKTLAAMKALHDNLAYHLLVVTAPLRAEGRERWQSRIEVFPRLTKIGGFEWASGMWVNQRDPADAADRYRRAFL